MQSTPSFSGSTIILSLLVSSVLVSPIEPSGVAHGTVLHVAPGGSDAAEGTEAAPLGTLAGARDAIRRMRTGRRLPAGGVTVLVVGGVYPLRETLALTDVDSGEEGSPIVYRARPGERVVLTGGAALGGFRPIEEPEVLARLGAEARKHALRVDLRAQGISDLGQLRSRGFGRPTTPAHLELFWRGQPMTLARWPNDGFVSIAAVGEPDAAGDGHGGKLGTLSGGFHYEGDRPSRWKSAAGAWVHGYWAWDWANSYEEVASLDPVERRILTKPPHGLYGFRAGQRFYFLNVLEELDAPGEYFVDAQAGALYFWPPEGSEPAPGAPAPLASPPAPRPGEVTASLLEAPLISLTDVSHVTFRALALECARGTGVEVRGGAGVRIADCALQDLGNYAVSITGGRDHAVIGCEISQMGDGGVILTGGDRRTLEPAGHLGLDNHLHHLARWSKCYCPAFLLGGVGCRVSNNVIHDHPHCAILFTGNEHIIELNELHHVCLETGDVGAIYTGRDWTYRGNILRHNFIHETGGVGMGSMGAYLDDCVSGVAVLGNVFYRVQRAAFVGGGRDNRIEGNIFVDCVPAVSVDGRGLDPSPVWHDMVYKTMKERLEAMRPTEPPYAARYPELAQLTRYYEGSSGVPPEGNRVARNLCVGGQWLQVGWHAREEMLSIEDNIVDVDPGFVDRAKLDFRLRDDSPAYRLGFEPIPFERIGRLRQETAPRSPEGLED